MSTTHLDPSGMTHVIAGKRYAVNSATLLADNDVWDGSSYMRGGRNIYLYKTKGSAYFKVTMTSWPGERNIITSLDREKAMEIYERLPGHHVEYEEAFDAVVEEASAPPGRPTTYGEKMKLTSTWLPVEMIDWLKSQPGGAGETIRALVKTAMDSSH